MASIPYRALQNEDSESNSLHSEAGEHRHTSQYGTITGSTGSAPDLRFILLGDDESLMIRACDIILRERAERTEICLREGRVCGRKISVVKTHYTRKRCCCLPSRCKSMKKYEKYEMKDCALKVFPGPHAFLLVTDNRTETGEEYVNIITEVFGEDASAYVVVVIIGRPDATGISSVNGCEMCFLEDNDESVQDLFRIIENMTRNKEFPFFIQSSFKNAFLSWEKDKHAEIRRETEKLLREKEKQHVKEVTEKLRIAKGEIKDKEEQHAQELSELKKTSEITENNLKKDNDNFKCLILNTLISKDGQQKDDPGAASAHKSQLNQELEACIHNQAAFIRIFSSIIDGYIDRENELKEKLKESEHDKDCLRNMCYFLSAEVKEENKELQQEVDQLKTRERELKQKLTEAEDREAHIKEVETHIAIREADVTRRENELEAKERETAERDTHLSASESNICPGGESREEDSKREDHKSDSRGIKPVRRNSKLFDPPEMREGQSGKEDSKARKKMNV